MKAQLEAVAEMPPDLRQEFGARVQARDFVFVLVGEQLEIGTRRCQRESRAPGQDGALGRRYAIDEGPEARGVCLVLVLDEEA